MNDFIIILSFKNAGIFEKRWKNGESQDDRILDNHFVKGKLVGTRNPRREHEWLENGVESLHYTYVANVLRVMFGQRPVPKYRKSVVSSDENVVNLAKRCSVKITTLVQDDKGKKRFPTEAMTMRKALDDSWSKSVTISWERFRQLLGKEFFDKFVSLAEDVLDLEDPTTIPLEDVATQLWLSKDKRVEEMGLEAANAGKTLLKHLLIRIDDNGSYHGSLRAGLPSNDYNGLGVYLKMLVVKGVAKIARIDGEIAIPVTKSELDLFREGGGYATLMEGGLVTIKEIINMKYADEDLILLDYNKVAS